MDRPQTDPLAPPIAINRAYLLLWLRGLEAPRGSAPAPLTAAETARLTAAERAALAEGLRPPDEWG